MASLKSRYRKTIAGFLWVILSPLLMFGVQSLVFKHFLKLQIHDYNLFLVSGLLPWIFFSTTLQMGTPVFVSNAHLLRSFKINPLVILSSQVLDNFINFCVTFLLIFLPFYLTSDRDVLILGLLPLAMIPLLIGTLSLCLTLSTINVFFRDTNFVMGFVLSIAFYLTPIFYPRDYIPDNWYWIVDSNPIYYFLAPFRNLMFFESEVFFMSVLKGLAVALGFLVLATLVWKRKKNVFYHKI